MEKTKNISVIVIVAIVAAIGLIGLISGKNSMLVGKATGITANAVLGGEEGALPEALGMVDSSEDLEVAGDVFIRHTSNPKIGFGHTGDGIWASIYRESSSGKLIIKNDQGNPIILDNGNVGIGTADPTARLHIGDGGAIQFGRQGYGVGIGAASSNMGSITVDTIESGSSGDPIELGYYGKAPVKVMSQLSVVGNVGIGTTSPSERLHVVGKLRVGNTQIWDNEINRYLNDNLYIGYRNTNNTILQLNGGNVGIGTASPGAKLDVSGTLRLNNDVILDRTNTDNSIVLSQAAVAAGRKMIFQKEGGGDITSVFVGNVGIGTASPAEKLDVVGKVAINSAGVAKTEYMIFKDLVGTTIGGIGRYNNGILLHGPLGVSISAPGGDVTVSAPQGDIRFTETRQNGVIVLGRQDTQVKIRNLVWDEERAPKPFFVCVTSDGTLIGSHAPCDQLR